MLDKSLEQQEKELYYLQRQKISQQEQQIKSLLEEIEQRKQSYEDLVSHYQHNLQVIKERDVELDQVTTKLLEINKLFEKSEADKFELKESFEIKSEKWQKEKQEYQQKCEQLKKDMKYNKRINNEEIQQLHTALKSTQYQLENLKQEKQGNRANIERRIRDEYIDMERDFKVKINQFQVEKQKLQEQLDIMENNNSILQEENKQLNQRILREKQVQNEMQIQHQNDIQILRQKMQQQQIIIDQLKRDLDQFRDGNERNEKSIQQKLLQVCQEKQELEYQLLDLKQQKKQKVRTLKDNQQRIISTMQKEYEDKIKKLEYQVSQLTIDYEKQILQETTLKDKLSEIDSKLLRVTSDYEQRLQLLNRNCEQDKKQLKTEIEHKQLQLTQAKDEQIRLKETQMESNRLLDNLASKVSELKNENKLLIEQIVQLRKQNRHEEIREQKESLHQQIKKKEPMTEQKVVKKHHPVNFLADADDAESYEKIYSGDEGPIDSFIPKISSLNRSSKQNIHQHHMLQNNSKIKQLETENNQLKMIIQDMGVTMESTKDQLMLKVQEANLQRQNYMQAQDRIMNLMQEINKYKEQIHILQQQLKQHQDGDELIIQLKEEIDQLSNKLQKSKDIIIQLRQEREKLLEITNELNEKIREQTINDNDQFIHLQTEVKFLQNQLKQLKSQKGPIPNLSEIQNQLF